MEIANDHISRKLSLAIPWRGGQDSYKHVSGHSKGVVVVKVVTI